MIEITPSVLRGKERTSVTEAELLESTRQHKQDIVRALHFFRVLLLDSAVAHDLDKIKDSAGFHDYFTRPHGAPDDWFSRRHVTLNRHHLGHPNGVPADVNLIDVLDYVADCVTSGLSRRGEVFDVVIDHNVLRQAFENTVALLKAHVRVVE